jgi:hypothetical protein
MTRALRLPWRIAGAGVVLVVLLAVFMLYTRPDFLVQMANQIWACF